MTAPTPFDEGEPQFEPEPEPWRPPVACPRCQSQETRFLTMNYERSIYACQACGNEFEIEE